MVDRGPDGLAFAKPAALSFQLPGELPEGKDAAVAWLDGEAWVALEGSAADGTDVWAPIGRLSSYAVVFVDGAPVVTAECPDKGEPCGGAIVGTWQIVDVCFPNAEPVGRRRPGGKSGLRAGLARVPPAESHRRALGDQPVGAADPRARPRMNEAPDHL